MCVFVRAVIRQTGSQCSSKEGGGRGQILSNLLCKIKLFRFVSQPSLTSVSHQHLWSVVKFMYIYTSTQNTYTQYHHLPLKLDKTMKKEGKKCGGTKAKINTAKQVQVGWDKSTVQFVHHNIWLKHADRTLWEILKGAFNLEENLHKLCPFTKVKTTLRL